MSAGGKILTGLAAAGIGFAVGGPAGAFIGLGMAWGASEMMPAGINIEGPKMGAGDLFNDSSYGAPIPKTYGRVRLSGNIIWIGAVKETATSQDIGGGGFS